MNALRVYAAGRDELREIDTHLWCPVDGVVEHEPHARTKPPWNCDEVHRRIFCYVAEGNEL